MDDKILLTAFLSALAGFITAVLSIVKLVNEKESKTTDYRQAWTDSARKSLAELIGRLNTQAGTVHNALDKGARLAEILSRDDHDKYDEETHKRVADFNEVSLKETHAAFRQLQREIYESYALTRLHFKPNDLSFNRIEQKFDSAMAMINEISKSTDKVERAKIKEKIHATVDEITGYARDILKTEWETVKKVSLLTKQQSDGPLAAQFLCCSFWYPSASMPAYLF